MNLEKKRWLILAASCLITLCIGSLYGWSVFGSALAKELSVSSLAIVFTVANAVGPITMISGGYINDKLGPRLVLIIGGILFGLGMFCSGFATSTAMIIVTYGLGVGLGCGMVYGTVVSNAVKFFPDKSGFAGGLITACYGGSSIIVPIIATAIVNSRDVFFAFKSIGIVMTIVILLCALIVDKCPDNFMRDGSAAAKAVPAGKDFSSAEMLRSGAFYLMLIILTCGAFSGMMVISQASSMAQRMMSMTPSTAAAVVSLIALFNMLGRLVSGTLSDKLGAIKTMTISFAISVAANLLLGLVGKNSVVVFYISLAAIGFCFGSVMGIYPGFTAKTFGRKNNSVNYGIMFIGFALAGILGPMIMTNIYAATGGYAPAFFVAAALGAAGEVLIAILKKKQA
ncbi:MAG: OFA family MFS transporter [Oscillospiraceae bacterium]|nr:OFA family MFS transporter [Oscillospiraceae bacterium]